MDPSTLVVGVLLLAPVQGELEALITRHEMPLGECKIFVDESAKKLSAKFERVTGMCLVLPPKPGRDAQPAKPQGLTL